MKVDIVQNDKVRWMQELERKANDLVHLMLFTESKWVPLKRDKISKKAAVLRCNMCSFKLVLACAQDILCRTFRMELHELQTCSTLEKNKEMNSKESELLRNTGMKKCTSLTRTKTYILHSVLDPVIIEHACAPDANILVIKHEDMVNNDEVYANENNDGPCTCSRDEGCGQAWVHVCSGTGTNAVKWCWDPCVMSEFMAEFMLDRPKVESEDENTGDDADRMKKVEVVMKDIKSTAGGDPLQGLV
ncbi:uncharacterized protein LAESUDRAFT_714293 [Laetiporus sulphureus 93-53]|uniref:MAGE domain-containing protein n=1 Tax=Laetiporus sulphureus 93-53 TaxID=1314785 RepID=A0A165EA74_9APHY|nr:uncharacterized protein LAESUDRAFT_714293 [Laetiporus sulphureus 93-53]KZT06575.1 hypothetical protein LAESUDRAFT_714293 [Laetiporus sulphureus 93-53]